MKYRGSPRSSPMPIEKEWRILEMSPAHSKRPHSTPVISNRLGLATSDAYSQVHQRCTTSSSFHLSYLKVTPLPLRLGRLPQAQLPQYFRYLWHSTAELKAQSLHRLRKPNCVPSASASATVYTSTNYFKNFNIIFRSLPLTSADGSLDT